MGKRGAIVNYFTLSVLNPWCWSGVVWSGVVCLRILLTMTMNMTWILINTECFRVR